MDLLEEAPAISTQSYGKPIESDRAPYDVHKSPVAVLEAPIIVYRSDLETYRNPTDSHRALKCLPPPPMNQIGTLGLLKDSHQIG